MKTLTKIIVAVVLLLTLGGQRVQAQTQTDVCALLAQMETSVNAMGTKGKPLQSFVTNAIRHAGSSDWSQVKTQLGTNFSNNLNRSGLSAEQKTLLTDLADQIKNATNPCCKCTPAPPAPIGTCNLIGFWKSPSFATSFAASQSIAGDWEFRSSYTDDAVGHWNGRFSDGNDWIFFDWQYITSTPNDILRVTLVGDGNSNSGVPMDATVNSCTATTFTMTVGGETNSFTR